MFTLWLLLLSWCYGIAVYLYQLYYLKVKKSITYQKAKVIGIGNLSLGGTGKTPLVIYLTKLFIKHKKVVAILSRGYKRRSIGFKVVNSLESPTTVGDEPYLIYKKFENEPNVMVSVCKNRIEGITQIMLIRPNVDIILLDDALQQFSITTHLHIVLTTFAQPFFKDYLLPLGRLREPRKSIKRADIVLVTKSPINLAKQKTNEIKEHIKKYHPKTTSLPIYFSHILYLDPLSIQHNVKARLPHYILLVTGIAYPLPLRTYLENNGHTVIHLDFPDHHCFTYKDILNIIHTFHHIQGAYKAIVTTEKDRIRFVGQPWEKLLSSLPMYYIPIEITFTQQDQIDFNKKIMHMLYI